MRTVWKYPIPVRDYFKLRLPQDAHILTVETQYGHPQLWALVDTEAPLETRGFRLAGMGHPIAYHNLTYIGTIQQADGHLVWHLFEIAGKPTPT